jgi:hypothetical protein
MGLGKVLNSSLLESGPHQKIAFMEILSSAIDLRKQKLCTLSVGREEWLSQQLAEVSSRGPVGRGVVELG